MDEFKTVTHPSSDRPSVRFRLPSHWREGPKSGGLISFYPEGDEEGPCPIDGQLFVFVHTIAALPSRTVEAFDDAVRSRQYAEEDIPRQMAPGQWVVRFKKFQEEKSHRAVHHSWFITKLVSPDAVTIAMFLFAGVDLFYTNPGDIYYDTVEMLEREILAAEILGP
jgi:hypothetical protein